MIQAEEPKTTSDARKNKMQKSGAETDANMHEPASYAEEDEDTEAPSVPEMDGTV